MTRFLPLLLCAALLGGCGESAQRFVVDNPTSAPLHIVVDDQAHTVAADSAIPLTLAPGAHRLRTAALGEVPFIVYAGGDGGLINPTLSDYVIGREIYVTDASKLKNFGTVENAVTLQGVTVRGPFEARHALFIGKQWDYGLREPFPERAMTYVADRGGNIKSKLFGAAEFIAYYEAGSGQPGYFAQQRAPGWRAPRRTLETAPPALPPLAPAFEAHAAPLRQVYARYLHASDPAQQRQLQKDYFQAMLQFTAATATLGADLGAEANQARNDFVLQLGQAFGSPALVAAAPAAADPRR
ncbi:hypothetical protein JR065_01700 [Xanthomonas sp. AmX2]|uniref:hypothetical protein n=1 Tax=Xanthomonas sp. TaxID=29446 RepID=UPI00197F7438|nr:hypothetical protein [Xanthomonas sp.]MBN6149039.1 hypothetical protein [Xanthomonas sp.]